MTTIRGTTVWDRLPPGCRQLLLANGVLFLISMIPGLDLTYYLALTPTLVLKRYWIWQVVTYAFIHEQFFHFFFNMFALWMFGPHVEFYWGTKTFLRYYFLCTLGAAAAQILLAPTSTVIGASGAIYGLLLAFGFLFPDAVLYLFFFFPLRAIQAVLVIAVMTFVSSLGTGGSKIAHLAHLGGMLTGFLYFKFPIWTSGMRSLRLRGNRDDEDRPAFQVIRPEKAQVDLTAEVDRILEKISKHGVNSLTPSEHETMKRYSREKA